VVRRERGYSFLSRASLKDNIGDSVGLIAHAVR